MRKHDLARAAGVCVVALVTATGARADAIDGNWCANDGRHFTIQGPSIVTPAGNQTQGDYSRHAFSYTVPSSEKEAGLVISMTLLNEQTLALIRGSSSSSSPAETWRRCNVTS